MSNEDSGNDRSLAFARGLEVIGFAIMVLTATKIPAEASVAILLLFFGAGEMLAQYPEESKRIAKAVADLVLQIFSLFGEILIGLLTRVRDLIAGNKESDS